MVTDAANTGCAAFKFDQVVFEFCTEGCVFDVMDFALKAFFLAEQCHTAFFCTQMGMVVYAEKDIKYAVLFTCYAKKTAHDVPPIMYRIYSNNISEMHIDGENSAIFILYEKMPQYNRKRRIPI